MKTRLFALVLAGTTSVLPALAQNSGKATAPAAKTPTVVTPAGSAPAAAGKDVAAEVNGEKISLADLNRMMDSIKASEKSLQSNSPEAQKTLVTLRAQMLDELIATKLLSQEAKRQKITVPSTKVDAAITEIKGGFKTDAEFQSWLKQDNKSVADLREVIADELAIRELSTRLSADVTVSNDDIATFYRTNIDQFTVPEGVKAHHILLAVNPSAPAADKERVKQRALALIKQLKANPSTFEAVAKSNSDDKSNSAQGGNLGAFPRGSMVKPFEDAAFAAKVGDIVGPVATDYGFHIIRVDEKIPAKPVPLADVQKDPQLKAFLLKQKVQKKIDDAITGLKAKSKIQKYA